MFKDVYAKRTCIQCDGTGYCETSTTSCGGKEEPDVKIVHDRMIKNETK